MEIIFVTGHIDMKINIFQNNIYETNSQVSVDCRQVNAFNLGEDDA